MAMLDATMGRFDEARDEFRTAARLSPGMGRVYWLATISRCIKKGDELFQRAEALSRDIEASQVDRALAEMAVGRALIHAGDKVQGFAHLKRGNALLPMVYDPEEQTAQIDRLMTAFPRSLYVGTSSSDRGEGLVFIVGLPRSGSTLVEQILASHPMIHGVGESPMFLRLVNQLREQGEYPELVGGLDSSRLDRLAGEYLAGVTSKSGNKRVITDKNLYNLYHLGLIALALPRARVIHCRRNVMDHGLSIYSHWFSANYPYATDLGNIAHHYAGYRSLMQHWKSVLPLPIYEVQYENLVDQQELETRRLLEFLGVPFDASCLAFQDNKRTVATSSLAQVRQGISKGAVGAWREFETELEPLRRLVGAADCS
jgi:hypothetical protein